METSRTMHEKSWNNHWHADRRILTNNCHHRPNNIILNVVTYSSPGWSIVQWRQTRGAWLLCKVWWILTDDHWDRGRGKERKGMKCFPIYVCVQLQSPEVLLGKTISVREKRQGMSRRKRRRGNPEDQITKKKVDAHHVGCVGDDGGDVSDGGEV